jgi:hypothetical protein
VSLLSETSRNYFLRVTQNTISCSEIASYTLTKISFPGLKIPKASQCQGTFLGSPRRPMCAFLGATPVGEEGCQEKRPSQMVHFPPLTFKANLRSENSSHGGYQCHPDLSLLSHLKSPLRNVSPLRGQPGAPKEEAISK